METEPNLPTSHNHENGKTSDHVIAISTEASEWLASLEDKISKMPKLLNKTAGKSSCCIFRVPKSLAQINEKAYQPHIVSIGPYHHGNDQFQMIEEHKWRFLGAVLTRTKAKDISLDDFFKAIAPKEEEIRECYSENIGYSSHQLIEMMILDGCFIIELLCIVARLENQIPFFVLESLFGLVSVTLDDSSRSLTELALEFFDYAVERPAEFLDRFKDKKGKHLLDLFRSTFIPPPQGKPNEDAYSPFLQLIQSAKKLRLSGIKFKPKRTDSFLDISFSHGVLRIPPLTVDDFTSSFLLNCVAFEQCYKHCSKHITSYVTFMGCLINTPADAGYLSDHRIIENYFGTDDEVAKFFNDVGKDITFDIQRSYLSKLFKDVNKYYRNNFHIKWAGFKHTYFDSPWSFMSAMAALILLLLTIIQAFFAVYPYASPSHKQSN
ncbi:UPF0481 protein At3g47200 isoform X1 [Ricinus communis]|uniref:UPF0481 protein At3g47200 isoform X1 n=1 Tax=Ricinus communis TaxID=3988 RepID=UPI00201AB418|nr:UPF0481 protein At3g47200 isoform X1 [Ricinus communis]